MDFEESDNIENQQRNSEIRRTAGAEQNSRDWKEGQDDS